MAKHDLPAQPDDQPVSVTRSSFSLDTRGSTLQFPAMRRAYIDAGFAALFPFFAFFPLGCSTSQAIPEPGQSDVVSPAPSPKEGGKISGNRLRSSRGSTSLR